MSRDDHDLVKVVDNIQGADYITRRSEMFRLGVVTGQWLVIDALANTEKERGKQPEAAISEALDFAKQRFHEMRQLQKKLGVTDNMLFEGIHRDNDVDAKRQLDLYARWD